MFKERIEAVLSNISYVISGIWQIMFGATVSGVSGILLGLGSGYHHWILEDRSQIYDFAGMYLQGISLLLWILSVPLWYNVAGSLVFTALAVMFAGSSRTLIGLLIGTALLAFGIKTDLFSLMTVLTPLSIAWTFNYIGDNALKEHHSEIHGPGWHQSSAFSIMLLVLLTEYPIMKTISEVL